MTDHFSATDLAKEFNRGAVSWRIQGKPHERGGRYRAMALAYIDARDVMDRLDEVCGPENWQDKYEVLPSGLYVCHIGIRIAGEWVWKSDGAGETAVEGKKGGISDAFKRCGVKWGVGRYLYRLDSPWVQCEVRESGGKVYWKSWSEDPWSKVKTSSYQKAEAERNNAHTSAAISNINAISDMATLRSYFEALSKETRLDPDVVAAKDARKTEISKSEAA